MATPQKKQQGPPRRTPDWNTPQADFSELGKGIRSLFGGKKQESEIADIEDKEKSAAKLKKHEQAQQAEHDRWVVLEIQKADERIQEVQAHANKNNTNNIVRPQPSQPQQPQEVSSAQPPTIHVSGYCFRQYSKELPDKRQCSTIIQHETAATLTLVKEQFSEKCRETGWEGAIVKTSSQELTATMKQDCYKEPPPQPQQVAQVTQLPQKQEQLYY